LGRPKLTPDILDSLGLDDLDINALITEVEEADFDHTVLDELKGERDFKSAPNIVKFITEQKYLNLGQPPFPKQVELLAKVVEEWCPNKRCTDKQFWRHVPVDVPLQELFDRVTFLEHGICPNKWCRKKQIEWIRRKGGKGEWLHGVSEVNAAIGMRASKTTMVAGMLAPYQLHRLITLPVDPAKYFGLFAGRALHMSFVAITARQAADTLWQAFRDSIDESKWFKRYFDFLDERGEDLGQELLHHKATFLWLPTKRIHVNFIPANMRTMRGRSRVFAAIDELGWFSDQEGRVQANATETYEALVKSLQTIRSAYNALIERGVNNPPTGLMANVGSPYEANDKIMQLLRSSRKKKRSIAFHCATWDFNPNIKKDDPEMEEQRLDKGDVIFMRDFGAEPPLAANPLVDLTSKELAKYVDKSRPPLFKSKTVEVEYKGNRYLGAELTDIVNDTSTARIMLIDAGESMNSYALSLMSIDFQDDEKLRLDASVEVKPTRNLTVSFPAMLELADKIIKMYQVLYVVYDRWQSTHHIQKINDTVYKHIRGDGPIAERYTLTAGDFDDVRDTLMTQDRWSLPKPEVPFDIGSGGILTDFDKYRKAGPISHLMLQILTVRQMGRKVLKPIEGDDDLFRTLALGVTYLSMEEVVEDLRKHSKGGRGRASTVVGIMKQAKHVLTGGSVGIKRHISSNVGGVYSVKMGLTARKTSGRRLT
jgi:hypothetical protein